LCVCMCMCVCTCVYLYLCADQIVKTYDLLSWKKTIKLPPLSSRGSLIKVFNFFIFEIFAKYINNTKSIQKSFSARRKKNLACEKNSILQETELIARQELLFKFAPLSFPSKNASISKFCTSNRRRRRTKTLSFKILKSKQPTYILIAVTHTIHFISNLESKFLQSFLLQWNSVIANSVINEH
jgi:hypothetical protein